LAAFFFAADLAAWHAGILLTKLGNATLFGNVSSFFFAAWGLWLVRKWPSVLQAMALSLAAAGCGLLMWGSAELSASHLRGDLLAVLAGLLYTGYLILVERTRGELQPLPLLYLASLFGASFLLPAAVLAGEQLIPADWTSLFALALCSQVIGQGLLVYALGHVPPLVVGVAMLTQPALSALLGWIYYGEAFTPRDWTGAAMIVAALILVRMKERGAPSLHEPVAQPN
jgi:drug/metabolite transporter (DMT)-like permease